MAPDRPGRWGTDILKERSYVWLLVSRLFFLMAPSLLLFLGLFFLTRTLTSPSRTPGRYSSSRSWGGVTGLATFPAAKLSDRVGRKQMIYVGHRAGRDRA